MTRKTAHTHPRTPDRARKSVRFRAMRQIGPSLTNPRETPPNLPPWATDYLLFRDWDIPDDPFDPTAWHNPDERNPK